MSELGQRPSLKAPLDDAAALEPGADGSGAVGRVVEIRSPLPSTHAPATANAAAKTQTRGRAALVSAVRRCARNPIDEIADRRIGHGAGDVGLAHHSDQLRPVDHGKPPDGVLLHRPDRLLNAVVGSDRDHLATVDQLAKLYRFCVAPSGDDLDGEVAVGDDAAEAATAVAHRYGTDVVGW